MIENINDFLSVAFLVFLLLMALFEILKQFSKRHARHIMAMEKDYYFQDFEEDEEETA